MYDKLTLSLLQRLQWATALDDFNYVSYITHLRNNLHWPEHEANNEMHTILSMQVAAASGEHYFIEDKFIQTVHHAAQSAPEPVFDETILLSPAGWAYFENPVQIGEHNFKLMYWAKPDFSSQGVSSNYYVVCLHHGYMPGDTSVEVQPKYVAYLAHNEPYKDPDVLTAAPHSKFVFSMFHLLSMKIADVHPTGSIRENVKNQVKRFSWATPKVVTLRRPTQQHTDGTRDVEWNCQWHVRGHWRQQPYRSTGQVRPVFIEAYIKGPADKPLKPLSHNIFVAKR